MNLLLCVLQLSDLGSERRSLQEVGCHDKQSTVFMSIWIGRLSRAYAYLPPFRDAHILYGTRWTEWIGMGGCLEKRAGRA